MLKNAYLLSKIGADTAENERHFAKILRGRGGPPADPRGGVPNLRGAGEFYRTFGVGSQKGRK